MMKAQEVEALGPSGRSTILVLSGCNRNPSVARTVAASSRAARPVPGWRTGRRSRRRSGPALPAAARRSPTPHRGRGERCWPATERSANPAGCPPPSRRRSHPRTPPPAANLAAASTSAGRRPGVRPGPSARRGRSRQSSLDVSVEHPHPAPVGRRPDRLQGLMGRALRAEPETAPEEVGLEDRFEHDLRCRHHHPVSHSRDAERPGLPRLARLGDVHPPQRLRPIRTGPQLAASPSRKRRTPEPSTSAMVTPSTPGAPWLAGRRPTPSTSRRCGRPCRRGRGTDVRDPAWHCGTARVEGLERGPGHRPRLTDLADMSALISVPPSFPCIDEAGALRSRRVVLSRPSSLLRPPPTPSRPPATSRDHRL